MEKKVFYPRNRRLMLILGYFLLFNALLILFLPPTNSEASATIGQRLFSALIPAAMSAIALTSAYTVRLVLSDEGVEFHQLGMHAYTPWDNVIELGPNPQFKRFVGLHLNAPAKVIKSWTRRGRQAGMIMIPLTGYKYDANSALGKALTGYMNK
jgi:hypothetical protein